jgi:two-component system response regulator RegA
MTAVVQRASARPWGAWEWTSERLRDVSSGNPGRRQTMGGSVSGNIPPTRMANLLGKKKLADLPQHHESFESLKIVVEPNIPGASWYGIIHALSRKKTASHIVVVTAFPSMALRDEARRLGLPALFSKPVGPGVVFDACAGRVSPNLSLDCDSPRSLARIEWEYLNRMIADCDGNMSMASVGRQAHGARRRGFRQGHGATESPGSWGQSRVIGSGNRQGHGASRSPGSWGHL